MSPFDPRYMLFCAVVLMRDRQKSAQPDDNPALVALRRAAEAKVDAMIHDLGEPQLPDIDAILAAQAQDELPTPFPFPIPELPEGGYK